jgi:hypothetical protein
MMESIDKINVLEQIKAEIESMDKYNQIEVLKILSKNLCKINENKSGVYVNLSFLDNETMDEIQKYIDYSKQQEESLVTMEYQKDEFKNAFFIEKGNKDNMTISYNSINK